MIGRAFFPGILLLAAGFAAPAAAKCSCQKTANLKLYGTVSGLPAHNGPHKPVAFLSAQELAAARIARGDLPVTLPLRMAASRDLARPFEAQLAALEQ